MMSKRQKVKHDNNEVAYELTSKKKHSVSVRISVPDKEDECPLNLEPIATSRVDFLKDASFFEERPLHTKLTLPCGHGFYILSIIYHFCKNGMQCPCCRQGREERADPKCLPKHLRKRIMQKVKETTHLEEEEEDRKSVV